MKKALVASMVVVFAGVPAVWAGIDGSKHDFAGDGWNNVGTNTQELCAPCHTPHNAQSTQLVPLWNHKAAVTNGYQMYSSTSLQGTIDNAPSGASLACLSCHDGTVALNAYGANSTNNSGSKIDSISASLKLGTDLRNDHPISITYSASDSGLNDKATTVSGLPGGGHIDDDLLINDKVECSSCHDAHGGTAGTKLLQKSNANSGLCTTCHNK